MEAKRFEAVF